MFQGVWYVPAGESFLAEYIRDAAGDYLWKDTQGAASLSLNFEKVFLKAFEADIWIDVGNIHSLKEMLNADLRYGKFAAFQNKEVYNFDARLSPNGGFDIYESGAIQPHLVLKDLIKIFHP
jgi:iron complex transport system substrate-binding protein